ncbi:hypothetical protein ELB75_02080 [Eikenella corrodens]|uniref:Transposase n=1 Tax=Eikenella corrodens TaxID=539 RepID=A0A3S9SML5_EIKCO|nr:hypothetical protein ELB75_02080 [Eikenella corrodens]
MDTQLAKSNLCDKTSDVGRTAADNRLFVEAVLQIVRAGSLWPDLLPHPAIGAASANAAAIRVWQAVSPLFLKHCAAISV